MGHNVDLAPWSANTTGYVIMRTNATTITTTYNMPSSQLSSALQPSLPSPLLSTHTAPFIAAVALSSDAVPLPSVEMEVLSVDFAKVVSTVPCPAIRIHQQLEWTAAVVCVCTVPSTAQDAPIALRFGGLKTVAKHPAGSEPEVYTVLRTTTFA
jgi:hypothetical protein